MNETFTFEDYLEQLDQIRNMGPIENMLAMVPGVDTKALKNVNIDEKQFDRLKAIILSMTVKERRNPSIINFSRKKRIAAGSGTDVSAVNNLLKQFEAMKKMMKQFKGGKKMRRGFNLFGR